MTKLSTIFPNPPAGYWGSHAGQGEVDAKAVRNGDVGTSGQVRWSMLPTRSYAPNEFRKARLQAGDMVLTTSGNCGNVAYIDDEPEFPTVATNFVRILRVDPSVANPRYIFHFLRSPRFTSALGPYIRGATIKNLSVRSAFANLDVPLPSREEQRRIAAILDHADALRTKRRQELGYLNSLSLSVFNRLLLEESPFDASLSDVATFYSGASLPVAGSPFDGQKSGTLLMKVSDMNAEGNEERVARTALWTDSRTAKAATVPAGAIVLPKRGAAIATNKKRVTTRTTALDPNLMGVVPLAGRLETLYLYSWFRSFDLTTITSGSTVPQLNKQDLAPVRIPLPSLDVQRAYAGKEARINALRAIVQAALTKSDELFASLQSRAFRGEL